MRELFAFTVDLEVTNQVYSMGHVCVTLKTDSVNLRDVTWPGARVVGKVGSLSPL